MTKNEMLETFEYFRERWTEIADNIAEQMRLLEEHHVAFDGLYDEFCQFHAEILDDLDEEEEEEEEEEDEANPSSLSAGSPSLSLLLSSISKFSRFAFSCRILAPMDLELCLLKVAHKDLAEGVIIPATAS